MLPVVLILPICILIGSLIGVWTLAWHLAPFTRCFMLPLVSILSILSRVCIRIRYTHTW